MAMRSEYTVIRAESIAGLIRDVTERCRDGWHPLGGLVVNKEHTARDGIAPVFYQALTREDPADVARIERDRIRSAGRRARLGSGIEERTLTWTEREGWKEIGP